MLDISDVDLDLPSIGTDQIAPDPGGTTNALGRIGYRIEEAIADLIDNSIDAAASTILVRVYIDEEAIRRVVLVDDGRGMDDSTLHQAMQVGAPVTHGEGDLGKYGLGLKAASFSQGRSMSVITRQGRSVSGRRWTREGITNGWLCDRLDPEAARRLTEHSWCEVDLRQSGTIVIWDELDRFRPERGGLNPTVDKLFRTVPQHLGLVFHRFLQRDQVRILLDSQNVATRTAGLVMKVLPLDPFSYQRTGLEGYPRAATLQMKGLPSLHLVAHIWPPKAREAGYKLGGGKVAERQGFYFYRNDRLIQAGGWNRWREQEAEPHFSLARIQIELPPELDSVFSLNVQKSRIDVPPEFGQALDALRVDGWTMREYLRDANEVYRTAQPYTPPVAALLPGRGIPRRSRSVARRIIAPDEKFPREVRFSWTSLEDDELFRVDRDQTIMWLNRAYRDEILQGSRAEVNDAPMIKLLLFLLLRDDFDRQRDSAARLSELDDINVMLIAAARDQS